MMREIYPQILRNVCIVLMRVCVCLYIERHGREGRRQTQREGDRREMVNESKH